MKSVRCLIPIGLLGLLPACQVGLSGTASPLPSSSGTPVASQTPSPQPSATPTQSVESLERYANNAYCEPLGTSLATRTLDYLHDVVASPDGQTVYLTFSRHQFVSHPEQNFNLIISRSPSNIKRILSRQLIYRLDSTGQMTPLQIAGNPPHSCHLTPEIEKDAEGRLFMVRPLFEEGSTAIDPTRGYVFSRWTPGEDSLTEWASLNLNAPDPSPSSQPEARDLIQLHLPTNSRDVVYYGLKAPDSVLQDPLVQKLSGSQPETLLMIGRGGPRVGQPFEPFTILPDGALTYGTMRVVPPYPADTRQRFTNTGQPQTHPQWQSLIPETDSFRMTAARLAPNGKILYISDNTLSHSVWKLDLVNGQASRLAGSGQAGYRDGAGEQAQFNRPGALDTDRAGNLYLADVGNQAIRKITPEGIVSTLFQGSAVAQRPSAP